MGARMSSNQDAYDNKRVQHERELGCFGILSRVACQAIIASLLVAIAVLSIISLVYRGDRWAVYWTSNPAGQSNYDFHAGWNTFGSTYSAGGYHSLLDFSFGCWVIGWICFAFLLACLVLAVVQFVVAVTNQAGRHTCALGVPLGVCTVCMMAAYILAFIVETREYSYRTTPGRDRYTPNPGFAWITGTIAGALWVVAGSAGCCMPSKHPKTLPATSPTATPTSAVAPVGTAAPERRGWFGRDKRAGADVGPAAAGVGAGTAAGESKYGAYPDRDVEVGHDSALGTPGAAHTPGSGYNNGVGVAGSPGYGTTPTSGYGAADPALAPPANVPEAVPGQKRRGGFLGLTGMGKKGGAEEARATGAPSAPPAPAVGAYEQPPGGAASAWSSAGHGLSGTPAT